MAINVTVAGVGGTTVTLPWTSVTNAAAAQAALGNITNLVKTGTLEQVNYSGGGTLPPISAPATEGGVIAADSVSGLSPFGIGGGGPYVSAVVGSAGPQSILVNFGANNATVVSGEGGSTISGVGTVAGNADAGVNIGNLGTNTQVFMGGAATQNFSELGLGAFGGDVNPSATVWVTTPTKGKATFDDSSGSTTINVDTVASPQFHPFGQTYVLLNSGDGQTTINVHATTTVVGGANEADNGVDGDVFAFRGTSTVATTVNAAGGGGAQMFALVKSGSVFIDGGASEVILIPTNTTGPEGTVTLFGGSGFDVVAGASGLIEAGTKGGSILFGSTVAGAATLIGGGSGDVLVTGAANDKMVAGAGNESLYAEGGNNTLSGFLGAQPAGSNTYMQGLFGGDTYNTGSGGNTTIVSANDSNGGNLFQEGVSGANGAEIIGFATGADTISLANPNGGTYSLVSAPTTVAPTPGQVTFQYVGANTEVSFGDGTTWTVVNQLLHATDFK